jgi:hypothetical protein
MLQTVSPLILMLSLFLVTAAATHLVMSFGQTLIHYKVAHHSMGRKIFRNHINFHARSEILRFHFGINYRKGMTLQSLQFLFRLDHLGLVTSNASSIATAEAIVNSKSAAPACV